MSKVSPSNIGTALLGGAYIPLVVGFSVRALAQAVAAFGATGMGATGATGTHPLAIGAPGRMGATGTHPLAIGAPGTHPWSIDHFADQDCREASAGWLAIEAWGSPNLPAELEPFLLSSSPAASPSQPTKCCVPTPPSEALGFPSSKCCVPTQLALLGGGTENWPELIDWLSRHCKLLGPTANQMQLLRQTENWQRWCAPIGWRSASGNLGTGFSNATSVDATGIRFPETLWQPLVNSSRLAEDLWLCKPRHAAGGHAISTTSPSSPPPEQHYYQRRILGHPLGVTCILQPQGRVHVLGATSSLTETQWPGPSEFIYRGSIGPTELSYQQHQQISSLCQTIQRDTGCRGWLQLDFIEDPYGQLWLLELNPRWSAGMEVLLRSGLNPVAFHLAAWGYGSGISGVRGHDTGSCATGFVGHDSESCVTTYSATSCWGKGVVYADRELRLTKEKILRLQALPRDNYADLPALDIIPPDQPVLVLRPGQPLLTVLSCSAPQQLLEQLHQLREVALEIVS